MVVKRWGAILLTLKGILILKLIVLLTFVMIWFLFIFSKPRTISIHQRLITLIILETLLWLLKMLTILIIVNELLIAQTDLFLFIRFFVYIVIILDVQVVMKSLSHFPITVTNLHQRVVHILATQKSIIVALLWWLKFYHLRYSLVYYQMRNFLLF